MTQDSTGLYSGFIVVKLSPASLDDEGAGRLLEDWSGLPVSPLITSLSKTEVLELEREAEVDRSDSLACYWRVDAREAADVDDRRASLAAREGVELVYQETAVSDPAPPNDVFFGQQDHLTPAPQGIGAEFGWSQVGAGHAGIRFIDLEQGWFDHVDLPARDVLPGVPDDSNPVGNSRDHGTQASGVVAGVTDNNKGVAGVAVHGNHWSIASHYDAASNTNGHVANAIYAVLSRIRKEVNRGDVLLLEVQTARNEPIEVRPSDWTAIRTAARHGIVVVEPAGNGDADIDATLPKKDSGAILVGASVWDRRTGKHTRWTIPSSPVGSNFGRRVHCFGSGQEVVTTGGGSLDPGTGPHDRYSNTFGGTSASAAIVAGAAVLIQNVRRGRGKSLLTPAQMRAVLTANGTPSTSGNIGVMPDMTQAVPVALGLP